MFAPPPRLFDQLRLRFTAQNYSLSISLIFFSILLISSCGNRRPPIPPARRSSVNDLSAVQQGNKIRLKILAHSSLKEIKQVSIYRLSESPSAQLFLSEEDFSTRSTLIGTASKLSTSPPQTAYYDDVLSDTAAANRLRYAVRFIFADNRRSALSNFLVIEPTFRVPLPPALLDPITEQTKIRLRWDKPLSNLDATQPANLIGYNIYRVQTDVAGKAEAAVSQSGKNPQRLNQNLIADASFDDLNFEFGVNYQYFVRAVTNTETNALIESLDSNLREITPRDVFPPAPPQSLTIAAAPGRLSLFFASNSETDLAGYLIYRSNDASVPLGEWRRLTPQPLAANTFQDAAVEAGQKYSYYLQAIDKAGNISKPSEIISEIAP